MINGLQNKILKGFVLLFVLLFLVVLVYAYSSKSYQLFSSEVNDSVNPINNFNNLNFFANGVLVHNKPVRYNAGDLDTEATLYRLRKKYGNGNPEHLAEITAEDRAIVNKMISDNSDEFGHITNHPFFDPPKMSGDIVKEGWSIEMVTTPEQRTVAQEMIYKKYSAHKNGVIKIEARKAYADIGLDLEGWNILLLKDENGCYKAMAGWSLDSPLSKMVSTPGNPIPEWGRLASEGLSIPEVKKFYGIMHQWAVDNGFRRGIALVDAGNFRFYKKRYSSFIKQWGSKLPNGKTLNQAWMDASDGSIRQVDDHLVETASGYVKTEKGIEHISDEIADYFPDIDIPEGAKFLLQN